MVSVSVSLCPALRTDAPLLAAMNLRLMQVVGSRTSLSVPELEVRMNRVLSNGYYADLFRLSGQSVGYALYQFRWSDHFLAHREIYLRQFFLEEPVRGQGLGKAAFALLRRERFWASLGFSATRVALELDA